LATDAPSWGSRLSRELFCRSRSFLAAGMASLGQRSFSTIGDLSRFGPI
jgi:hypothetical protein